MNEFLASGRYVDSAHPAVVGFTKKHSSGKTPTERAVSLYYAVRDEIRYNPFLDFSKAAAYRASAVLEANEGFARGRLLGRDRWERGKVDHPAITRFRGGTRGAARSPRGRA